MRIDCPYCGPRSVDEFSYGGDATIKRPETSTDADDWVDYTYLRDNPNGWHLEYWHHISGCRAWLVVSRNTSSHQIREVQPTG